MGEDERGAGTEWGFLIAGVAGFVAGLLIWAPLGSCLISTVLLVIAASIGGIASAYVTREVKGSAFISALMVTIGAALGGIVILYLWVMPENDKAMFKTDEVELWIATFIGVGIVGVAGLVSSIIGYSMGTKADEENKKEIPVKSPKKKKSEKKEKNNKKE